MFLPAWERALCKVCRYRCTVPVRDCGTHVRSAFGELSQNVHPDFGMAAVVGPAFMVLPAQLARRECGMGAMFFSIGGLDSVRVCVPVEPPPRSSELLCAECATVCAVHAAVVTSCVLDGAL